MKRIVTVVAVAMVIAGSALATIVYPSVKYGQQVTVFFELYDSNSPWRAYGTAPASDDVYIRKDGGAAARATNSVTDLGRYMSLVLTATEMQAAVVTVDVNDETSPKAYGDELIVIPTHGHASALNAVDLDDSVRAGLTALPNAAADAAGGLAISDAGGLDLDQLAADAAETVAWPSAWDEHLATLEEIAAQIAEVGALTEDQAANLSTAASAATDAKTSSEALQSEIGTAGAGLTALGDTRLDNLNSVITTTTVFDGTLTWDDLADKILAILTGKAVRNDLGTTSTWTFYKQDGTTPAVITTSSDSDGSRAAGSVFE